MYCSLPLLLLGLAATVTASGHTVDTHFPSLSKRNCEQRNVFFRYNDSSLGNTLSCSWDVLNLAAKPVFAGKRSLSPRTCEPGQCADGGTTNYTVQSGDSLELIAAKFDSGVCDIAIASGIADNPDFILPGQVLQVPTDVCDPDNDTCRTPPGTRPCVPQAENPPAEVTIEAGNTFFLLGVRYNVTADAFIAANLCLNPSNLQIGDSVTVPVCPQCG